MDAKLKARWVKALRSKKYKQGQGALERDNKFCCLGVLAKVVKSSTAEETENYLAIDRLLGNRDKRDELVARNDNGMSFAKIATFIEKNL